MVVMGTCTHYDVFCLLTRHEDGTVKFWDIKNSEYSTVQFPDYQCLL